MDGAIPCSPHVWPHVHGRRDGYVEVELARLAAVEGVGVGVGVGEQRPRLNHEYSGVPTPVECSQYPRRNTLHAHMREANTRAVVPYGLQPTPRPQCQCRCGKDEQRSKVWRRMWAGVCPVLAPAWESLPLFSASVYPEYSEYPTPTHRAPLVPFSCGCVRDRRTRTLCALGVP
jgi:hypothetical protein